MSKVKKIAVHEVEYSDGKKRKNAVPGSIFEIESEHVDRLEKLGAIREPSEAELALYEKQNKRTAPKAKSAEGEAGDDGEGDDGADRTKGKGGKGGRKADDI